jgi:hypothetical protein
MHGHSGLFFTPLTAALQNDTLFIMYRVNYNLNHSSLPSGTGCVAITDNIAHEFAVGHADKLQFEPRFDTERDRMQGDYHKHGARIVSGDSPPNYNLPFYF